MNLVTLINSVTIDLALGAVWAIFLNSSKRILSRVIRRPFYEDAASEHETQEWKEHPRLTME